MVTLSSSGTQLAVINTEHTLYNPTTSKWFSAYIDLTNMVSGDTTEIRAYVISKTAGSYIIYYKNTYVDAQTYPLVYISPMPSDIGWKLTLKQTVGTGRNYDWRVYEV
jgi:hypothetical protein